MKSILKLGASTPMLVFVLLVPRSGECFYNPTKERWLNRDPIQERGGKNLRCFVQNNPASLIDPRGLCTRCGVRAIVALLDRWEVQPTFIRARFHVTAWFKNDPESGYNPSCCKVIQWTEDKTRKNGQPFEVGGNPPTDGNLHIDRNPYIREAGDDITDPRNYDFWTGFDQDPAPDVLTYTDPATRAADDGDVLSGYQHFYIIVYDYCNHFKPVASTQFGYFLRGTWPDINCGVN